MSAKGSPTVSVIIPAYGNPGYVSQALDSVRKQTFTDYEIILVDDCSPENLPDGSHFDTNTRIIRHSKRRGPAATRNTGIMESRGRYIALLDADDLWLPDKLKSQVGILEANPGVGMTFCHFTLVDSGLKPLPRQPRPKNLGTDAFRRLLAGNVVKSCSVAMVAKDALEECGMFDEQLCGTDDWDLWLRITRRYSLISDPSPLVLYRVHEGQFSQDSAAMRLAEVVTVEKWLSWLEFREPLVARILYRTLSHRLQRLASAEARGGNVRAAFRSLWRAICADPFDLRSYIHPPELLLAAIRSRLRPQAPRPSASDVTSRFSAC